MSNTALPTNSATTDETVIQPNQDILDKYREADKKGKAAIRAKLDKEAKDLILAERYEEGKVAIVTLKALKSDKPVKEVDFGQIVADGLFVAFAAIRAISSFADENGVEVNWDELVLPDISDMMDDQPISDEKVLTDKGDKVAKSLLRVKSDRRNIQGVFDRAFHNSDIGDVLVVADICRMGALPDYAPGSGAVAARLANRVDGHMELKTDDCTLIGYKPVWADKSGQISTNPTCPPNMVQAAQKVANRDDSDIEDESDEAGESDS